MNGNHRILLAISVLLVLPAMRAGAFVTGHPVLSKMTPGEPYALNLAKKEEHHFYRTQLTGSGILEEKRPQFFRALERQRLQHAAGHYRPYDLDDFVNLSAAPVPSTTIKAVTAVHTITEVASDGRSGYKAAAISSVNGGTLSTALTLRLFDAATGNPIGAGAQGGGTDGGVYYDLVASGADPTKDDGVYALFTYAWVDQTGAFHGPYAQVLTATDQLPIVTNMAPTSLAVTIPITICINRTPADSSQCTYGKTTSDVLFQVRGAVSYPGPIDLVKGKPANAFVTWAVIDVTAGGGCMAFGPGTSTSFFTPPQTTTLQNGIIWNWQPADFGRAPSCFQQGHRLNYVFVLGVNLQGRAAMASITSTVPAVAGPNAVQIAQLRVFDGCIAAGTRVRMADGSWKRIETFEMANERVASGGNRILTVAGNTSGREAEMIRIVDDKGHTLLLTGEHPVVLRNRGVVLAKTLTTGDTVLTDEGDSKLVSVTRVPFSGTVHNLELGIPGESFGKDDTTMYAEHILVGDRRMQQNMTEVERRAPERILAGLPPQWREDYLNELDGATARRLRSALEKQK